MGKYRQVSKSVTVARYSSRSIFLFWMKLLWMCSPSESRSNSLPSAKGFHYLVAIMDWYSRYAVAWRLSNTLDADFCVEASEEALGQAKPKVFNTAQGSQFTGEGFTGLLDQHGIRISMDGKGRYSDNIFIERLWRTVKYE